MTALYITDAGLVPQSRQASGSYKLPIEAQAALAVGLIEKRRLVSKGRSRVACA